MDYFKNKQAKQEKLKEIANSLEFTIEYDHLVDHMHKIQMKYKFQRKYKYSKGCRPQ